MGDLLELVQRSAYEPRRKGEYSLSELAQASRISEAAMRSRLKVLMDKGRVTMRDGHENGRQLKLYSLSG